MSEEYTMSNIDRQDKDRRRKLGIVKHKQVGNWTDAERGGKSMRDLVDELPAAGPSKIRNPTSSQSSRKDQTFLKLDSSASSEAASGASKYSQESHPSTSARAMENPQPPIETRPAKEKGWVRRPETSANAEFNPKPPANAEFNPKTMPITTPSGRKVIVKYERENAEVEHIGRFDRRQPGLEVRARDKTKPPRIPTDIVPPPFRFSELHAEALEEARRSGLQESVPPLIEEQQTAGRTQAPSQRRSYSRRPGGSSCCAIL